MGRPKTLWVREREALVVLAAGGTLEQAGVAAGVTSRTVSRIVADYGRMLIKPRKVRPNGLRLEEREKIWQGIHAGHSAARIARDIGRSASTVSREIQANGDRGQYSPLKAEAAAVERARRGRQCWTETRPWLWDVVVGLLFQRWSPQQISQWLRREHPDDPDWWVSHESIYQAIYVQAKPELRKELLAVMRQGRVRRVSRAGRAAQGRSPIRDMVNISERPAEVEDRAVPGHWEGDLIIGANGKSAVVTLVERSTRMGMLLKIEDRTATTVAAVIAANVRRLPAVLFRSLTWDQGIEMAGHQAFTLETNVQVYFCDPRSPWQRGTNENWNGLVRQYLPKGTDLSVYTQDQLDAIAIEINGRPRMTLGWDTPAQRFNQLVATSA